VYSSGETEFGAVPDAEADSVVTDGWMTVGLMVSGVFVDSAVEVFAHPVRIKIITNSKLIRFTLAPISKTFSLLMIIS
jgi:hypothetical protein